MRTSIAVFALMTMAGPAIAQSGILGCGRPDADPQYCHNGKPRAVCNDNGHLIWQDSGDAISMGELHFLSMEGRFSTPPCGAPSPAAAPAAAPSPASKPAG